jgi:RNA polymerase subunit RPABC4/transcription elongation factor Spt4
MPEQLANLLGVGLEWVVAVFGGLVVAFWVGLVIWTWRDIRHRSTDIFAAILATLLVAIFNVVGLLLYLLLRPRTTLAEQYDRALEEEALLLELEQARSCPKCGRPVQVEWQYCPYCEVELRQPCRQCGRLLEPEWKRCPHCGAYPVRSGQPEVVMPTQPVPPPPVVVPSAE